MSLGGGGRALALAVGAALVASPIAAARADEVTRAEALARAAGAQALKGERRAAITLYEEANAAAPNSELLCEIARQYDALATAGDPRDVRLAVLHYEGCLRAGTAVKHAGMAERLAFLRDLRAKLGPEPPPIAAGVVTPAGPPRVPIRVVARDPAAAYQVTLMPTHLNVDGEGAIHHDLLGVSTCTTPCTIAALPGVARLRATGPGELDQEITIPSSAGEIQVQTRSTRDLVVGGLLLPVGGVIAGTMWLLSQTCGHPAEQCVTMGGETVCSQPEPRACITAHKVVWPLVGVGTIAAGVALIVRGRHPSSDANRVLLLGSASAPRLELTTIGLGPSAGGDNALLGFAF